MGKNKASGGVALKGQTMGKIHQKKEDSLVEGEKKELENQGVRPAPTHGHSIKADWRRKGEN